MGKTMFNPPDPAEYIRQYQGRGDPPPKGEIGPACSECGQSIYLEVGGGAAADVYHPNIDVRPLPGVDMVVDLNIGDPLPFHAEHAERIKSIHMLNHLSAVGAKSLLKECLRVLRHGGSLYIMVTDIQFVAERIVADGLYDCWSSCIWGTPGDTYAHDFHLWGYSPKSLEALLKDVGFTSVHYRGVFNAWEFKMEAFK